LPNRAFHLPSVHCNGSSGPQLNFVELPQSNADSTTSGKKTVRARTTRILCAYSLLACCLLSVMSCGGSANQQVAATPQAIPLRILTTQAADGIVGQKYSFQVLTSGGGAPFNWSLALGNLPPGVALDANSGLMSGSPTQAGNYSFTVEVTDSTFAGSQAAMQSLSIAVSPPTLAIPTPSLPGGAASVPTLTLATPILPGGVVGQAYDVHLQASGGTLPYTWSILSGSLASGVQLNPLTGEIAGTPTQVGEYSFTVEVTDSASGEQQTSTQSLGIAVSAPTLAVAAPVLAIATPSLPGGVVGEYYSVHLQVTGGVSPYTWSILSGSLATGLELNPLTGEITGTPTLEGNYLFTVEVADSTNSGPQAPMQSLSITISLPTLTIATPSLPDGVVGQPYYVHLQASGGTLPYTWSILSGSLASGVQLNPLTGEITGTPTQAGTSFVTILVTDSSSPQNIARLILGGPMPIPPESSSN